MAEMFNALASEVFERHVEWAMQQWANSAALQINAFHARLDAVLFGNQQHLAEAEWRLEGTNPSDDDRLGTFYGALDDMREDRIEYQEAQVLALLHERLDALQQERGQDRPHEQGMEY